MALNPRPERRAQIDGVYTKSQKQFGHDFALEVWDSGCMGFEDWASQSRVESLGFRVAFSGIRVQGLRLRV